MAEYKFKWDMDKQLYVAYIEGEKFAIVCDNVGGHYRVVDAVTFENIIDEEFNKIEPFNRFGYAKFTDKENRVGLFDKNFEKHLSYAEIEDFNEDGFAIVSGDNNRKGVIDANLNEVLPCRYGDIKCLESNFYLLKTEKGKVGIATSKGKIALPCEYEEFQDCESKHNYKTGVLWPSGRGNGTQYVLCDLNSGKEISERFDEDFEFDEETGATEVYQEGKGYGLINEYGKIVLPCGYKDVEYLGYKNKYRYSGNKRLTGTNFYFLTNYQDKKGLATSEGKIIIPCEYTDIEMLSKEGVFAVGNGDIYSLVNTNGQTLLSYDFNFVMKDREKGIYKIERIDNGQKLYLTAEGKEIPTKLYRKKQLKNLLLKCVGKEQEKGM